MIVVDTNQLAYLLIGGTHTAAARDVLLKDPAWAAPVLITQRSKSEPTGKDKVKPPEEERPLGKKIAERIKLP